ncbi:MAG: ribonuclease HII [Candidatus Omnitrophota bacterium]
MPKLLGPKNWEENNRGLQYFEKTICPDGYRLIAGVDEAGRGPLAGPVVAAAVVVKQNAFSVKIFDSKRLSLIQREKAYQEIVKKAYVGIGIAERETIDRKNILEATIIAIKQAIEDLDVQPEYLLIDGRFKRGSFPEPYQTVIKGDSLCFSIACASIVAKVFRDNLMARYAVRYPGYGFDKNRGYGTTGHLAAIKKYGLTPIHRRSFRPIYDTLI